MIVLVRCCCNVAVIPWVECLLAIRFACGVPRLYWIFYPIPFRSVSVCGFLFVFFVLFVFLISVFPMVSLLPASCVVSWICFRVLFPFLFMYCSMVSCFVFFLGCCSSSLVCFFRFVCFSCSFFLCFVFISFGSVWLSVVSFPFSPSCSFLSLSWSFPFVAALQLQRGTLSCFLSSYPFCTSLGSTFHCAAVSFHCRMTSILGTSPRSILFYSQCAIHFYREPMNSDGQLATYDYQIPEHDHQAVAPITTI